jgi:hypothetical protein
MFEIVVPSLITSYFGLLLGSFLLRKGISTSLGR